MGIGEKLKSQRLSLGLTLEEVGQAVGVGKSTVRKWENGMIKDMGRDKIAALSTVLRINPVDLIDTSHNMVEKSIKRIPVLGVIAAGAPLFAEQNIEVYLSLPDIWGIDYALHVKGDSMIDAGIDNGAIVLCKSCSDVNDNEIAVCLVDGEEATLKRIKRYANVLVLHPENSSHKDLVFEGRHRSQVKIIGRAVKVVKDVI